MKRRTLIVGSAAMLCAPAIIAGRKALASTPRDALVIGGSIDNVASFDPAVDVGDIMQIVSRNIYDFLVSPADGDRGRIVPDLGESWDVGAGGQTWTFRLARNARFASGNPVTAADVVYTFARMLKLGQAGSTGALAMGFKADTIDQAFQVVDPQTVRINFPQPFAPDIVLNYLASWRNGIVDSVLLKQRDVNGDFGSGYLRFNSAGSGTFKLAQWRPNDLVTLERNEGTWKTPAPLRRVLIRHMPEPNAVQLALQKGDIDLGYRPPLEILKAAAGDTTLQVITGPTWLPQHIAMNVGRAPFANVKVRQAMKYLVNYAALPSLCGQFSVPQQSLFEPQHLGYTGNTPFRLDIDHARMLLAESGLSSGFTTTLRARDYSVLPPVLEELQQNAAKVGIQIKLNFEAGSTLFPAWRGRDYDMAGGASNSYDESNDAVTDFMDNPDNEDRAYRGRRSSRSGWQNPEAQRLIGAARIEQSREIRADLYRKLDALFLEESPFVMLCNDYFALTARKEVKDVRFRSDLYLGAAYKVSA